MSLARGLEPEPDFPRTDLTGANASFLELVLGNLDLIKMGHNDAEKESWVFRAGHPALRMASRRLLSDATRAEAFDHGIQTYEAICGLVQSAGENYDMFTVNYNVSAIIDPDTDKSLLGYIDNAHQRFNQDLPLTAGIILESSGRFYPSVAHYAVYGAATARQFELDAVA